MPLQNSRPQQNCTIAYLVCVTSFLLLFIEFHIKCSNEDIFVLPLANPNFLAYVSSGWWVGDVTHDNVRAHEVTFKTVLTHKDAHARNGSQNWMNAIIHNQGKALTFPSVDCGQLGTRSTPRV